MGDLMYHITTIITNTIAYLNIAKRVDLKIFYHKKNHSVTGDG